MAITGGYSVNVAVLQLILTYNSDAAYMARRYTKELLESIVKSSNSFSQAAKKTDALFGGRTNPCRLKTVIESFGLDVTHFWNGGPKPHSEKIPASSRLIRRSPESGRLLARILRRGLLEIGREHICETCRQKPVWKGKSLVLEVHHKNGIPTDDRPENIQFICPNCHSQTSTFKNKNRTQNTTKQLRGWIVRNNNSWVLRWREQVGRRTIQRSNTLARYSQYSSSEEVRRVFGISP